MEQLNIFDIWNFDEKAEETEKYIIRKPIRLIELFG